MPTSAAERRYGRRGGGWKDAVPQALQDAAFAAAAGRGEVVLVYCDCPWPCWVVPSTAAKPCERCGEQFVRVPLPRSA